MATVTYDFCKPSLNIDGDEVKENGEVLTLGRALANIIMYSNIAEEDYVMKYFEWGTELKKVNAISLDNTDKDKLVKYIKTNPGIQIILKGQLLEVLSKGKPAK